MKRLVRFRAEIQQAANRDARRRARLRVYQGQLRRFRTVTVLKHAHQVEAVLTRVERQMQAPLFAEHAA